LDVAIEPIWSCQSTGEIYKHQQFIPLLLFNMDLLSLLNVQGLLIRLKMPPPFEYYPSLYGSNGHGHMGFVALPKNVSVTVTIPWLPLSQSFSCSGMPKKGNFSFQQPLAAQIW